MNKLLRIKALLFSSVFITAIICASVNPSIYFSPEKTTEKIGSGASYHSEHGIPLVQSYNQETNVIQKICKNFSFSFLCERLSVGILILFVLSKINFNFKNLQTFKSNKFLLNIISVTTLF